jgi:hypothetical protein
MKDRTRKKIEENILRLTGKEEEVPVKFNTICGGCEAELFIGDQAILLLEEENAWKFYVHADCVIRKLLELQEYFSKRLVTTG